MQEQQTIVLSKGSYKADVYSRFWHYADKKGNREDAIHYVAISRELSAKSEMVNPGSVIAACYELSNMGILKRLGNGFFTLSLAVRSRDVVVEAVSTGRRLRRKSYTSYASGMDKPLTEKQRADAEKMFAESRRHGRESIRRLDGRVAKDISSFVGGKPDGLATLKSMIATRR